MWALGIFNHEQYEFALSTTYQQFWDSCPNSAWLIYWLFREGSVDRKRVIQVAKIRDAAWDGSIDVKTNQLRSVNSVRSLIPRPDKIVEEYEHILKLKAFI